MMKYLFFCMLGLTTLSAHAVRYGQKTSAADFPEIAHIKNPKGFCTGTLIHPKVVLTVAHCVEEKFRGKVLFSRDGTSRFKKSYPVHKVVIKQKNPLHSELALIFLEKAVENIRPAEIDFRHEWIKGEKALIAGLGFTHKKELEVLHKAEIVFSRLYPYQGGQMWQFFPGEELSQACQGDSGGPLFTNEGEERKLTGTISFITSLTDRSIVKMSDHQQCLKADSSYYIPLYLHQDWIEEMFENNGITSSAT